MSTRKKTEVRENRVQYGKEGGASSHKVAKEDLFQKELREAEGEAWDTWTKRMARSRWRKSQWRNAGAAAESRCWRQRVDSAVSTQQLPHWGSCQNFCSDWGKPREGVDQACGCPSFKRTTSARRKKGVKPRLRSQGRYCNCLPKFLHWPKQSKCAFSKKLSDLGIFWRKDWKVI